MKNLSFDIMANQISIMDDKELILSLHQHLDNSYHGFCYFNDFMFAYEITSYGNFFITFGACNPFGTLQAMNLYQHAIKEAKRLYVFIQANILPLVKESLED